MLLTPVRASAPALLLLAVVLAGCSGGSDDGGGDSPGTTSAGAAREAPAAADGLDAADSNLSYRSIAQSANEPAELAVRQALIKRGNVELRAADVGKSQFEVQKVVDRSGGQVAEERTTTDDEGRPAYTRMVLRLPSARFDQAMEALKGVGELVSANTSEDDVTTKLIDTRTRLRVQQRSIDRITTLFDRAQNIRDIMAIEAQLSRRQAELESLQRQAAYLTNQSRLSTITVSVDQIPEEKAAPKKDDDSGFVAGLQAGWHGLSATAVALATVLGALLPWLVVLAILGPPALLVGRAVRRRVSAGRSARTPSAA